jgi:hypothetical protein
MKHLRKFEELNYSTYMSAADKLSGFGQTDKAKELKSHAVKMSRKVADDMTFGIMVGGVRPFPDAKFTSLDIFKTGGGWTLQVIFQSGNNTHRIGCSASDTGEVTWRDGNKFIDRKSVVNFQKALVSLANSQDELVNYLNETGLNPEDIKLVQRTFYV